MILGGHSAGASTAVAYAAWDFAGRPGYRDIDGLVLIDGGLLGSFDSADLARAKAELRGHPVGEGLPRHPGTRPPRDQRDLHRGGRAVGVEAAGRAVGAAGVSAPPGLPQAAHARHERGDVRLRVRRVHLARVAVDHPHPRRPARRLGRSAWVGERRADAAQADDEGVGRGVAERDRVVLPAPPAAGHRRREPAEDDAGGPLPRPASEARASGSTCRSTRIHRPDRGRGGARRAAAGADVEDRDRAGGGRPERRPPRPAVRGTRRATAS